MNRLHIPVPKVVGWCSKVTDTSVGAEYIIMEKVPGLKLSQVWNDTDGFESAKILEKLTQFDKEPSTNPSQEYGSLYYNADWDSSNGKFVVGPTTNKKYFDDERGKMNIYRCPRRSIHEIVSLD
jgi:hypothetical protein